MKKKFLYSALFLMMKTEAMEATNSMKLRI